MSTTGFDVHLHARPLDPAHGKAEPECSGCSARPSFGDVTYLWAVEGGALGRMRDMLATPTRAESQVTAFLSTWSYEQHWLTEMLRVVHEANGCFPQKPADSLWEVSHRAWDDRVRPTVDAAGTRLMGADVVDAHMVSSRAGAGRADRRRRSP